jgi:hypothetical protein
LLSRHDELKEKARQLLEATKREAREKDKMKRQNSKEKEAEPVKENGIRNGESPKKVCENSMTGYRSLSNIINHRSAKHAMCSYLSIVFFTFLTKT